ncbi:hypothetical protein MRX96_001735 [Rhipicephalus microplus]
MAAVLATLRPLVSEILMRMLDRITELLLFVANLARRRHRVQGTRDPLLLAPAVVLADAIRHGRVTSEDVILAYQRRVREVDPCAERRGGRALRGGSGRSPGSRRTRQKELAR